MLWTSRCKEYIHNNLLFIIFGVLIFYTFFDTFLIRFYDLVDKDLIEINKKIAIFSITTMSCLFFEILVVKHIGKTIHQKIAKVNKNIRLIHLGIYIYYLVMSILLIYIIIHLYLFKYYPTFSLNLVVIFTYTSASILITRALFLFYSWIKIDPNPILISLIVVMGIIILNLILPPLIIHLTLMERPELTRQYIGGTIDLTGGKYDIIHQINKYSSLLLFASIWFITFILMYQARDKTLRKIISLNVLILPIFYIFFNLFTFDFLSLVLFNYIDIGLIKALIITNATYIISQPLGGLIFGIVFWKLSMIITFEKTLRKLMILSGFGFLYLFTAFQSTSLSVAPYPPFGIITLSLLMLGCYLITISFYASSSLLSKNTELRKNIYKKAVSKLLDLIGTVEFEKEMERTVSEVVEQTKSYSIQGGINVEIDKEDLEKHLREVINELGKKPQK